MKKFLSLLLAICLCVSLSAVAFASNTIGISYEAEINGGNATIYRSDVDQTVTVRVDADSKFTFVSIGGSVEVPDEFELVSITHDLISFSTSLANAKFSYFNMQMIDQETDNVCILTFKVPANTEAGKYRVGIKDLEITKDNGQDIWERGGSAYATLTIAETPVHVTGVTLNKSETTMLVGGTETLTATVAPANADNKNVTWMTSNANVATVNNGVVTGVGTGTATITATTVDGNKTASCVVTVNAVPVDVTGVTLTPATLDMKVGGTATLTAAVQPENATNQSVTWTTSNASVVTVNNGIVRAVGEGTATVTVATADGGYTATCTVSVTAPVTSFQITFDAQGGTASVTSAQTDSTGRLASLPTAFRSNYTFDGWYTAETGGKKVTSDTVFTEDTTVYAHWTYSGTPSGDSSSSGSTVYAITVLDSKNGSVTTDRKTASAGAAVTLTVTADKGYTLDGLTVLDKNGKEIKLTEKDGKYTFTMPASAVTVEASFKAAKSGNPFVDVPFGSYYEDAVIWAVEKGVTSGTSAATFDPNGVCTRAQAVTFLWRAAGSPEPKSATMLFTDVAKGSYYEQAVLWAVENGITKGTSDTTFSPDATCSRAQIVTFLWRSQKAPAVGSVNPFTDVSADAYYADAVLWAVKESVTSGTAATTFSPDADCTRAQIVTFIYRALAE